VYSDARPVVDGILQRLLTLLPPDLAGEVLGLPAALVSFDWSRQHHVRATILGVGGLKRLVELQANEPADHALEILVVHTEEVVMSRPFAPGRLAVGHRCSRVCTTR
jgi:hypothetical protein